MEYRSSRECTGAFGTTIEVAVCDDLFRATRGYAREERVLHGRCVAARHAVAASVRGDGERILALRTTEDGDSILLTMVHRITSATHDGSASVG